MNPIHEQNIRAVIGQPASREERVKGLTALYNDAVHQSNFVLAMSRVLVEKSLPKTIGEK